LIIKFPGNQFTGEILPALTELVEDGIVHIVDLVLLHKNEDGVVRLIEITELEPDLYGPWAPLLTDVTELLNEDDVHTFAGMLENNSSAGVLLFENTWATRFAEAVRAAKGEVVLNERVPHAVVEEVMAANA
jgi:uncharacterized membrane protein